MATDAFGVRGLWCLVECLRLLEEPSGTGGKGVGGGRMDVIDHVTCSV